MGKVKIGERKKFRPRLSVAAFQAAEQCSQAEVHFLESSGWCPRELVHMLCCSEELAWRAVTSGVRICVAVDADASLHKITSPRC